MDRVSLKKELAALAIEFEILLRAYGSLSRENKANIEDVTRLEAENRFLRRKLKKSMRREG